MSNTKELGLSSLPHIKDNLDRLFTPHVWADWELETISDTLGIGLDELARDKIHILQIMEKEPTLFLDDMTFFLHSTKSINNEVADFEYLPMPSSLELAYAIQTFKALTGATTVDLREAESLIQCIVYLLIEEGFSDNPAPFDFIPKEMFHEGQTPLDKANKVRSIELYTKYMDSL